MAANIEIVIKGTDEFSGAFDALEGAFRGLEQKGGEAARTLDGMQGTFSGLTNGVELAAEGAVEFAQTVGESLGSVVEQQTQAVEEISLLQQEAAREMNEGLLEIDAEFQGRRNAQMTAAHALLRQEMVTHRAAVEGIARDSMLNVEMLESFSMESRLARFRFFFETLADLAASQGSAMAGFAKSLAIGEALISAYLAANRALAGLPYPLNLAAAALVLAQGLSNVERIRQVNVAHGGLENVPEDATFLLKRGERVLSPGQNRDLTHFLQGGENSPGQGVVVENLTIHMFENATAGDALLAMNATDMRRVVAEKILPALEELARLGIRPDFLGSNT